MALYLDKHHDTKSFFTVFKWYIVLNICLVTINKQDLKNNTTLNVLFQFQTIGRFPKWAPGGLRAALRVLRESAEPFSNDFNFSINELLNKYFLFIEIRGCVHCELSL
jgi:hypothetical protein